jgi:RNA polymerase sigma factor (sigma-70 family)
VDRVYRLAYRLAGDDDLARDITQDAFVRAFDRLAEFRHDAAFGTWLHRITVSVALNTLEKVKRLRRHEAPLDEGSPPPAPERARTPTSPRASPPPSTRSRRATARCSCCTTSRATRTTRSASRSASSPAPPRPSSSTPARRLRERLAVFRREDAS